MAAGRACPPGRAAQLVARTAGLVAAARALRVDVAGDVAAIELQLARAERRVRAAPLKIRRAPAAAAPFAGTIGAPELRMAPARQPPPGARTRRNELHGQPRP